MIHLLTFTYLDCWWWVVEENCIQEQQNSELNTKTKPSVAMAENFPTCLNTKGALPCICKSSPQITLLVKTMAV